MARTEFFVRKQSGGMFVASNLTEHPGEIFIVDSNSATGADSAGYGKNPDAPFLTLAYAFSSDALTANKGDVVILMPGHTESISADAGVAMDIAGVKVIGSDVGGPRPVITFDTVDTADLDIDAANITIENISFRCDIADLIAAVDVNAARFTIRDCSFMGTDAADEAFLITIITDATANDLTVENCEFHYSYAEDGTTAITTTSTECIRLVGADRAVIKDNYIVGDFTTSAINGITTASLGIRLENNKISNVATENITGAIDLHTGTTGRLDDNKCYAADPTSADDLIDEASCILGRNWVCNDAGEAMMLYGTADPVGLEGLIGGIDDATTDSLHGKLGTDTEMSDSSLFDMLTALNTASGTELVITKTIVSDTIPDDGGGTPLAAALTGAASGDLMLEEIIFQTDSATGLAGPTTVQVVCDNVDGLTGATVPLWDEAAANLGAAKMINNTSADVNLLPIMLESTKKLYINGDDGVGTGAGTVEVIMKFRRVTAGATIAAAA